MSLVGFASKNHPQQVAKHGRAVSVDDRATPGDLFAEFDAEFGPFTLDVAAAPHNTKVRRYFTPEDDGLSQRWSGRVWCNPPYSSIAPWVSKAWQEVITRRCELVALLLPANRTEQRWWQDLVEPFRDDGLMSVRFLPGRIRFVKPGHDQAQPNDRPPFGCVLVVIDGRKLGPLPDLTLEGDAR